MEDEQQFKTLLCLTALCLPRTRWAADLCHALGHVLQLSESSILGATSMLFHPQSSNSGNNTTETMLERAELMAEAFRPALSRQEAWKGFVLLVLIVLRGPEMGTMLREAQKNNRKQKKDKKEVATSDPIDAINWSVLQFNARTSVTLRRLALLLRIKLSTVCALEEIAFGALQQEWSLLKKQKEEGSYYNAWIRAAKIGAVATLAGGILAVTGGLAAPALVAGFSGLGLTTAATFAATAHGVAALLGAGGAGLGAYKMTKRTKGVTTFEFQKVSTEGPLLTNREEEEEEHSSQQQGQSVSSEEAAVSEKSQETREKPEKAAGASLKQNSSAKVESEREDEIQQQADKEVKGMTVHVCISGFLRGGGSSQSEKLADYYVPWGVEPPDMTPRQRLQRYYAMVAPEKVDGVVSGLLKEYKGEEQEQILFDDLAQLYGIHPMNMVPLDARHHFFMNTAFSKELERSVQWGTAKCHQLLQQQQQQLQTIEDQPSSRISLDDDEEDNDLPRIDTTTTATLEALFDLTIPWDAATSAANTTSLPDQDGENDNDSNEENEELSSEEANAILRRISDLLDSGEIKKRSGGGDESKLTFKSVTPALLQLELEALRAVRTTVDEGGDYSSTKRITESAYPDSTIEMAFQQPTKTFQTSSPSPVSTSSTQYWWRRDISHFGDQYTLVWEPETLLAIGQAFQNLIAEGLTKGLQEGLKYSAASAVMAAVALPLSIVQLIAMLDESWVVAGEAADEIGILLADALLSEAQGNRPVVLIGYSMGGRAVASCLMRLSNIARGKATVKKDGKDNDGDDLMIDDSMELLVETIENTRGLSQEEKGHRLRAATIVRDAIIIGAPIDTSSHRWMQRRSVVLGRLVNVYNPNDWILALLYRYKSWSVTSLAGLGRVQLSKTRVTKPSRTAASSSASTPSCLVENYDVSKIVRHHGDYPNRLQQILKEIGVGDIDYGPSYHQSYF